MNRRKRGEGACGVHSTALPLATTTEKILKRYWRDTEEILERYWRDTGEILERYWKDAEGLRYQVAGPAVCFLCNV